MVRFTRPRMGWRSIVAERAGEPYQWTEPPPGPWPADLLRAVRDTTERNAHIPGWPHAQRLATELLGLTNPPAHVTWRAQNPRLGWRGGPGPIVWSESPVNGDVDPREHHLVRKAYVHDTYSWLCVYEDGTGHVVAVGRPQPLATLPRAYVSITW